MIPDSFPAALIFVLLVVPGIAFTTVRDGLIGVRRATLTVPARILEALFVSVIFDAVYLIGFGVFWKKVSANNFEIIQGNLAAFAALGLLLFIVAPVAISAIANGKPVWTRAGRSWFWYPRFGTNFVNIPTAWDRVATSFQTGQFVRVRLEDGSWVGGWFARRSFVSTFPEPRDIFIEQEWSLLPDGTFEDPLPDGTGVWLGITDTRIVEWIPVAESANSRGRAEHDKGR